MNINNTFAKCVFLIKNSRLHLKVSAISILYGLRRPFEIVTIDHFEKYLCSPVIS